MSFAVGSLVRARGREWVVLPESADDLLVLRPLGGTDDEIAGVYLPLEQVESADFPLPDPGRVGDHQSCRLLRDALRLSNRAAAGPFRSLARIAVEPRPYQMVPLLMALKLDPVRLLIADDVGIGKTIEALLVARELLDRAEVQRLAVLCPPHLADQWQAELRDKFHVDAELVLPGTAARLERQCPPGQSVFDIIPFTVVSMDFIKSDRRRDEFARTCPELVIVDEAHTCAYAGERRGGRHQRHQLVKTLSADPSRHLILVTATPHSGKEEAFRSLLGLLDPLFAELPAELAGEGNVHHRRRLARHFVQRRRADIRRFLDADTPFPDRQEAEASWRLTAEYRRLFESAIAYARETTTQVEGERRQQRVRWWSALALLRAIGSSPAAAVATLRSRAAAADTDTEEEADEVGRRTVLDLEAMDAEESFDVTPGSDPGDAAAGPENAARRRLLQMARDAAKLAGQADPKLAEATKLLSGLVQEGFRPIVFCRFIATAEYVAEQLRGRLPKDVTVAAVTGILPPPEREAAVEALSRARKRVLVCTDCLSEGINLQDHFDAVFHYDLAWSPTRHEQREGRVDRYGQRRPTVRVLTFYGVDNRIDGIVLDVLIRKHKAIRSSLGISVPVPVDTNAVVEAIFEGLLLREKGDPFQQVLPGLESHVKPKREELDLEWADAAEREKRSRTMFAQEGIKAEEVVPELRAARAALGSAREVQRFIAEAVQAHGGLVHPADDGIVRLDLRGVPRALRDAVGGVEEVVARFELPVGDGEIYVGRTHPLVEGFASYVVDTALDPMLEGVARRAGVIRTRSVERRTTLLLARFRYHLVTRRGAEERELLAEETRLFGFRGSPEAAQWLEDRDVVALIAAEPAANIHPEQASGAVQGVLEGFDHVRPVLDAKAGELAEALLEAHRRVRAAAQLKGVSIRVEPKLPPDVLGLYVFLPAGLA